MRMDDTVIVKVTWLPHHIAESFKHLKELVCVFPLCICVGHDAMEVARDIVATITDPRSMVGPEVRETELPFCFHSSSSSLLLCLLFRRGSSMIRYHVTTLQNRRSRRGSFGSRFCTTRWRPLPLQTISSGCSGWRVCSPTSFLACPRSTSRDWSLTRESEMVITNPKLEPFDR